MFAGENLVCGCGSVCDGWQRAASAGSLCGQPLLYSPGQLHTAQASLGAGRCVLPSAWASRAASLSPTHFMPERPSSALCSICSTFLVRSGVAGADGACHALAVAECQPPPRAPRPLPRQLFVGVITNPSLQTWRPRLGAAQRGQVGWGQVHLLRQVLYQCLSAPWAHALCLCSVPRRGTCLRPLRKKWADTVRRRSMQFGQPGERPLGRLSAAPAGKVRFIDTEAR